MLSGKIQKIKKDHKTWLDQIDNYRNEISLLKNSLGTKIKMNGNKAMNDVLHHERILETLGKAIESHRFFIEEVSGEPGLTMEFLDLEGHERNHQHMLNFEDSFRKLMHEAYDTPDQLNAVS